MVEHFAFSLLAIFCNVGWWWCFLQLGCLILQRHPHCTPSDDSHSCLVSINKESFRAIGFPLDLQPNQNQRLWQGQMCHVTLTRVCWVAKVHWFSWQSLGGKTQETMSFTWWTIFCSPRARFKCQCFPSQQTDNQHTFLHMEKDEVLNPLWKDMKLDKLWIQPPDYANLKPQPNVSVPWCHIFAVSFISKFSHRGLWRHLNTLRKLWNGRLSEVNALSWSNSEPIKMLLWDMLKKSNPPITLCQLKTTRQLNTTILLTKCIFCSCFSTICVFFPNVRCWFGWVQCDSQLSMCESLQTASLHILHKFPVRVKMFSPNNCWSDCV